MLTVLWQGAGRSVGTERRQASLSYFKHAEPEPIGDGADGGQWDEIMIFLSTTVRVLSFVCISVLQWVRFSRTRVHLPA